MITPEEYQAATEALEKSKEQIRVAKENIEEANAIIVHASNLIKQYEDEASQKHNSQFPKTLDQLGLSAGAMLLIRRAYKAFGPGIKTEQLNEMLPYISMEALNLMSDFPTGKIKEIITTLGKYEMQIK
jgi:hypothetical protein